MDDERMRERLRPFLEAGLLSVLPTTFQIRQGELAMLPYVLSSDATDESRYRRAPFGHPLLRQPLILLEVGVDHLDPGCSLGARPASIITHLLMTYHQGMPVFDLQLLQTHPDGLDQLERAVVEQLEGTTARARHLRRTIAAILADPSSYHRLFLGDDGYVARARRFEYATPESEGSDFPAEFFGLVPFLEHCARTYPRRVGDVGLARLPAHLAHLATRRVRSGRWRMLA